MGYYRKKFLWLIPYEYGWCTGYTGMGYKQGIGFNLAYKVFRLFGFQVITEIKIDAEMLWYEKHVAKDE